MKVRRGKSSLKQIPGLTRTHVMLSGESLKDLDWLAAIYEKGNRSATVRQLIADQVEREIEEVKRSSVRTRTRT